MSKPFRPTAAGLMAFQRSRQMAMMLRDTAGEVAAEARSLAPSASGKYRKSFQAVSGFNDAGQLVGRVRSNDFKAHWIEFGTLYQPAQFVLGRAVEAKMNRRPQYPRGKRVEGERF